MPAIRMRLFDLHCDTLHALLTDGGDILQNGGSVDLMRGLVFSPWYQCFAAWVRDGETAQSAVLKTRRMLSLAQSFEQRYPQFFHILRDGRELFSAPQTPLVAILTVENGGVAAGADDLPDRWIAAGVKMVSLTWNGGNRWGEGCEGDARKGLTPAGKAAVRKMEKHGIVVDAAHLNRRSFWDLCRIVTRPFAVSHTASAAVCPSPRALHDTQFMQVRARGGIVGLDMCAAHLGGLPPEALLPHIEHFLALGGQHTLALGCDLDGVTLPASENGIRAVARLYERLLQRNYAESLIDDLFFENAYRFFKRCIR